MTCERVYVICIEMVIKRVKRLKGGEEMVVPTDPLTAFQSQFLQVLVNCNSKEKAKGKRVNPLVITHQLKLQERKEKKRKEKKRKKTQRNKRKKKLKEKQHKTI